MAFKMSVAIFLHASKVVDSKLVDGMLMYPTCNGSFKTDADKEMYYSLFEGDAPPLPYGGIGKKYGPEKFALKEVQSAVLQHMEKQFSLPKNKAEYWELDGYIHENLVFHPAVVSDTMHFSENPLECAKRALWQWTGMRAESEELKKGAIVSVDAGVAPVHVFHMKTSIDRAKWEWMNHMTEKRTLTDTEVTPYRGVLAELGIPEIIYNAYCKTHGGPRFIACATDVKDAKTLEIINSANINF